MAVLGSFSKVRSASEVRISQTQQGTSTNDRTIPSGNQLHGWEKNQDFNDFPKDHLQFWEFPFKPPGPYWMFPMIFRWFSHRNSHAAHVRPSCHVTGRHQANHIASVRLCGQQGSAGSWWWQNPIHRWIIDLPNFWGVYTSFWKIHLHICEKCIPDLTWGILVITSIWWATPPKTVAKLELHPQSSDGFSKWMMIYIQIIIPSECDILC